MLLFLALVQTNKQYAANRSLVLPDLRLQAAPIMMPDSARDDCPLCRVPFHWLTNKRHHCRACGTLVCDACSSSRLRLRSDDRTAERVCDACAAAAVQSTRAAAVVGGGVPVAAVAMTVAASGGSSREESFLAAVDAAVESALAGGGAAAPRGAS